MGLGVQTMLTEVSVSVRSVPTGTSVLWRAWKATFSASDLLMLTAMPMSFWAKVLSLVASTRVVLKNLVLSVIWCW